ncbi:MAG TPA: DUF2232 domain-containing protein [Rhizobiales bacterium]|nr:DUF2232 domain-containing protein [Hyphomicrobiales bacterium]
MPNWLLTGLAAGLTAAAMQGVIASPSLFNALIFYLSPLPLFLAGFSRGWASAALGALVMSVVLVVITGSFAFALMALVSAGLGPVLASGLSMITRTASAAPLEGETRSDDREWYPEGRLVLWLAGISALVTGISILAMGWDMATYKNFVETFVSQFIDAYESQMPAGQPPFPKQAFTQLIITAMPVAGSAMWLLATVSSMRIAIVVLAKTGRALRPWALFSQMAYPANSVIVLLASLLAAYVLSGIPRLLALGAVGAFVTAFTLLGLAIVHHLLAGNAARPFLLSLLYTGLLFFSWVLAVPLTVLGLVDLNYNFRKSKTI